VRSLAVIAFTGSPSVVETGFTGDSLGDSLGFVLTSLMWPG
jgi:hypothetical protein